MSQILKIFPPCKEIFVPLMTFKTGGVDLVGHSIPPLSDIGPDTVMIG